MEIPVFRDFSDKPRASPSSRGSQIRFFPHAGDPSGAAASIPDPLACCNVAFASEQCTMQIGPENECFLDVFLMQLLYGFDLSYLQHFI